MKVEQETFKSNVTEMQKLMHQLEGKHQQKIAQLEKELVLMKRDNASKELKIGMLMQSIQRQ